MSHLDDDMRTALRRAEPTADFAERVLARVAAPAPPKRAWWQELALVVRPPRLQWAALSVILSILIPVASVEYRKERQLRAQGEMARQQLVYAMRVAGGKLHSVQRKVLEISQTENHL